MRLHVPVDTIGLVRVPDGIDQQLALSVVEFGAQLRGRLQQCACLAALFDLAGEISMQVVDRIDNDFQVIVDKVGKIRLIRFRMQL